MKSKKQFVSGILTSLTLLWCSSICSEILYNILDYIFCTKYQFLEHFFHLKKHLNYLLYLDAKSKIDSWKSSKKSPMAKENHSWHVLHKNKMIVSCQVQYFQGKTLGQARVFEREVYFFAYEKNYSWPFPNLLFANFRLNEYLSSSCCCNKEIESLTQLFKEL